jgi:micrococcal nuclease
MRCHIFLRIIFFLITFLIISPDLTFSGQYQVIRVVDGDTIVIKYDGKDEKVRLLCVNTPESVHPDEKQNIPMGKVASNSTELGRAVNRRIDVIIKPKAKFDGNEHFNFE